MNPDEYKSLPARVKNYLLYRGVPPCSHCGGDRWPVNPEDIDLDYFYEHEKNPRFRSRNMGKKSLVALREFMASKGYEVDNSWPPGQ